LTKDRIYVIIKQNLLTKKIKMTLAEINSLIERKETFDINKLTLRNIKVNKDPSKNIETKNLTLNKKINRVLG